MKTNNINNNNINLPIDNNTSNFPSTPSPSNTSIPDILDTTLFYLEPDTYTVTLDDYKCIKTKKIHHTNNTIEKIPLDNPYLILFFTCNNIPIQTRLYSKRVNYFMFKINRQLHLDRTIKLSQILEIIKSTPITIETSYHPTYGLQVDYI